MDGAGAGRNPARDAAAATGVGEHRAGVAASGAVAQQRRKQFFFEKKNQKTFDFKALALQSAYLSRRSFCFFFQKEALPCFPSPPGTPPAFPSQPPDAENRP